MSELSTQCSPVSEAELYADRAAVSNAIYAAVFEAEQPTFVSADIVANGRSFGTAY